MKLVTSQQRLSVIVALLATLIALLALSGPSPDSATPVSAAPSQVIGDGGFESGAITPTTSQPECLEFWCADAPGVGGTVQVVTSPVRSGAFAAQIDTRTAVNGRFIYQDLVDTTTCFTWTFQVYRGSGWNTAELVADWVRGGFANVVSALTFDDTFTRLRGWDASETFDFVLSPGVWHEVVIEADGNSNTQALRIDGTAIGELTADSADFVPETVILGDTPGIAKRGLYTYDDVSLAVEPCPPPPVLLVHGSGGNCSSLDNVRSFLESAGYTRIDCFGYNSRMGGWWSAWNLKRFVDSPDGFKSRMGMVDGEEYYIVAHSFGGLVARYYAEEIGASQLGGIIMLGTPNGGAPEACAVRVLALDWWDMCLGSTFLTILNWGFDMQGRTYKGIAGTADNGRFVFNLVENDCIVYSWSVKGPLFNPLGFDVAKYNVRHATGFLCPGGGTTLLNDAGVLDDIVNTLNGAAGTTVSSLDATVQPITGPDALPAVPLLLSSSGSLTAGSTATESVTVEGGLPSMTVRLIWPEGGGPAASLGVSRPDDTEVQPTDSDVASWDGGSGGVAELFVEELIIDGPASGDWEVTVRAAASPPGSVAYLLQVEPESDVALQVDPMVSGEVGQPVNVRATVLNGMNPMTPDSITATTTTPGGGSSPIALTDNGLGTYEGSFVPGECGTFAVAISATANVGGDVTRYHEGQVDIGVDGDAGGDPCNPDEDGDDFDDGVELFVGTDPLAACPTVVGAHDAWPPDFNDDTRVNLADVFLFRSHFATIEGDPDYDRRFDLSADGRINLADVFILRQYFATQCAP